MASKPPTLKRLPWLLLVLSVSTGMVDAISVLGLGKVFTANMTGNVVFLGFAVAGMPGFNWHIYVAAIAAFLIGALMAGWSGKHHRNRPLHRWLLTSAWIEAALLWLAAVIAMDYNAQEQAPAIRLFVIVALTAVTMGYRNGTIRQLQIPDLTTTVLTLTITGLAADSSPAGGSNPNWGRRIGSIAAIFLGALLGAWMVKTGAPVGGLAPPLAIAGALILGGTLVCSLHPAVAASGGQG